MGNISIIGIRQDIVPQADPPWREILAYIVGRHHANSVINRAIGAASLMFTPRNAGLALQGGGGDLLRSYNYRW